MLNKIYKIKAECLTPLVIQSGREIMPWEYVVIEENGKKILYRFDLFEFYEKLSDESKKEFNDKLENAIDLKKREVLGIRKFIWDKKNEYKEEIKEISLYSGEVDEEFYQKYLKNINETKQSSESNQLIIKEFIRSKGRAFVPGSSIKGAIRTAILYKHPQRDEIENLKPEKSPFKYLLVGDSKFIDEVRIGYFSRSAPGYGEYLPKGKKFEFNIKVKTPPYDHKEQKMDFSTENIIASANEFIKGKIKKYIDDSKKLLEHPDMSEGQEEKEEKTKNLIKYYENLLEEINKLKNNEFILNLAFGGGFWYKSFFEKHPRPQSIKTFQDRDIEISRSLWMINHLPLGFIKCEFEKND